MNLHVAFHETKDDEDYCNDGSDEHDAAETHDEDQRRTQFYNETRRSIITFQLI